MYWTECGCMHQCLTLEMSIWHFKKQYPYLELGKPWPTGQIQLAGLSNPSLHTLLQVMVKTDVKPSVSCLSHWIPNRTASHILNLILVLDPKSFPTPVLVISFLELWLYIRWPPYLTSALWLDPVWSRTTLVGCRYGAGHKEDRSSWSVKITNPSPPPDSQS